MRLRYQIARFGEGFAGRPELGLGRALWRFRRRLRRIDGPYSIDGGPARSRRETMKQLRRLLRRADGPERFTVEGSSYDQPRWAIRAVRIPDPVHPLVVWGRQFLGRSSYVFAADGPPGPSDCSAFTRNAVKAVYGIELPHSAELQRNHPAVDIFHDPDRVEQGDLVFTNYGRKRWPLPDHVDIVDIPLERTIGSRPSTRGVANYAFSAFDRGRVVAFGRIRR